MSWIVVSLDPCQYLSNCALTPPLARQQSTDNKLGLMLGQGRGWYAGAQILTSICNFLPKIGFPVIFKHLQRSKNIIIFEH